jgi:hypothetical protein
LLISISYRTCILCIIPSGIFGDTVRSSQVLMWSHKTIVLTFELWSCPVWRGWRGQAVCAGTAGRLNRIIKMASSVRKGGAVASILVRIDSCGVGERWPLQAGVFFLQASPAARMLHTQRKGAAHWSIAEQHGVGQEYTQAQKRGAGEGMEKEGAVKWSRCWIESKSCIGKLWKTTRGFC